MRVPEPRIRKLLLALRRAARHRGGRQPHGDDLLEELEEAAQDEIEALGIEGPALVVRSGGGRAGEQFPLERTQTTIGRTPDCDIFLDDVTVSRRHAIVARGAAGFTLEDLGSLNGTFLNRHRIEKADLENGDEVQIGKYRLIYLAR